MTTLNAKNRTLGQVHRLLKFDKLPNGVFTPILALEPLTELEQQELAQIRSHFDNYLSEGRVLEGLVKALTTFPLLRLAGFYRSLIKIKSERGISPTFAPILVTEIPRFIKESKKVGEVAITHAFRA